MKATLDQAKTVLQTLEKAGYKAYLAGGCVRDRLLGRTPNDYDICTSAKPDAVVRLFNRTVQVGVSFGVVKVIVGENEIDVATFRTDGDYTDKRHPDSVLYTESPEQDVLRRDFTINALLMDKDDQVIDFVGGQNDLNLRLIRAVGDPAERFEEDPLRMLRAIRFSAALGFNIEDITNRAIDENSSLIRTVSKERFTDELRKMFQYGQCDITYFRLHISNLWEHKMEDTPYFGDQWGQLQLMHLVPAGESFPMILALMTASATNSSRVHILERLCLTTSEKAHASHIVEHAPAMADFLNKTQAEKRKLMNMDRVEDILRFLDYKMRANGSGYRLLNNSHSYQVVKDEQKRIKDMGWPPPLVTGQDILDMGYAQDPIIGEMLTRTRDSQLAGELTNKLEATAYIKANFPCAPTKTSSGDIVDTRTPRMFMAQCSRCGAGMSAILPRNAEGKLLWSQATNKTNLRLYGTTGMFVHCECGGKKSKNKFQEVVI